MTDKKYCRLVEYFIQLIKDGVSKDQGLYIAVRRLNTDGIPCVMPQQIWNHANALLQQGIEKCI